MKTLFSGIFPYSSVAAEHLNYFSYTPLFQYITSLIGQDPEAWLFAARLINTLALVGVGLLLAKINCDWKEGKATAWDFALPFLLWFSWFSVSNWMAMGRVDGLALFLQVLGLFFYLKMTEKSSIKILSLMCFILAFFTKQSAVWIPFTLMLWEAVRFQKKELGRWTIYFAGIFGGLLVLYYFSGGFVWDHLIKSNQNQFKLSNLIEMLTSNIEFHLGILLVAICGLIKLDLKKTDGLLLMLLASSLIWVVGAGREGSSSNFLLELSVVLTLLVARGETYLNKSLLKSSIAAAIVLITCWPNMKVRSYFIKDPGPNIFWANYTNQAKEETDVVLKYLREAKGPIWSENPALPMFAGKDIEFWPFEIGQSIARGEYSEDLLLQQLKSKSIAMIVRESAVHVVPVQRLSNNVLDLIETQYHIIYQNEFYVVYGPNP
ncbi:hypothetical protein [Bdellovibrio sp. HCB288]|uniref:hypothetical protein n=1 Tax=Bdellovibrio sp. HCB288 TaxID=3394355 RepID=UPI0039B46C96